MMGGEGLTQATRRRDPQRQLHRQAARGRLRRALHGHNGRVAHECIIDTRPLKERRGITVDDIAKRLIDCGFHAPTMSWPVPGTLMIEPTESETKAELDRFCDAMLAIREEARAIEEGRMDPKNNPLEECARTPSRTWSANGTGRISREAACFPPAPSASTNIGRRSTASTTSTATATSCAPARRWTAT